MINILIQGFALSGLYALLAVGFTMIFSVGRVLNLAYGVYIMLGGYVYYTVVQLAGMPKIAGLLLAVVAGVAFGVITFGVLVRRLGENPIAVEISTLMLAVVMQAAIILVFQAAPKTMWPLVNGVFRFEGVFATYNILAAMVMSWVALGGLLLFTHYTRMGRAIRAVSMDRRGAILSGIDPDMASLATWAISGALGALAGVFFATYTQLSPGMWVTPPHHRGGGGRGRRYRERHRQPRRGPSDRIHGDHHDHADRRRVAQRVHDAADHCRAGRFAQGPLRARGALTMRRGRTGRQLTLWLLFGAAMCIAPLVLPTGTVAGDGLCQFLGDLRHELGRDLGPHRLYQLRPSVPDRTCGVHERNPIVPSRLAALAHDSRRRPGGRGRGNPVLPSGTPDPGHLLRPCDAGLHGAHLRDDEGRRSGRHRRDPRAPRGSTRS